MTTGEKIKLYRKKLGLTQQQLAEMVGLQGAAISKYEKNSVDISFRQIEKIADALGTDVNALTGNISVITDLSPDNEKLLADEIIRSQSLLSDPQSGQLLHKFNSLNQKGRVKLLDYLSDLLKINEYFD